jgi:hypothetical protein
MKALQRWFFVLPLALGLGVALGGCDKLGLGKKKGDESAGTEGGKRGASGAPAGPLQKAPAPEWAADGKVKLGSVEGTFMVTEKLGLDLALRPTPKGTKVTSGAKQEVTTMDGMQALLEVDVAEALGKLSPEVAFDYKSQWKSGVKFTVALGGYEPVDLEAPAISPSYGLKRALEGVKNRGVSFGKEPDAPPREHTVVYLAGLEAKVIGPAKTLVEVDWVAAQEDLPGRRGKTCEGYKDNKGGTTKSLPLEQIDRNIVIYERKTAKEITRKKFDAAADCPMFAFGDTAKTYPEDSAIETWLRGERAKK